MNFNVMKHCWDSIELPEIIPHDIGVGLEFSDEHGNIFRSVLEHLESKRRPQINGKRLVHINFSQYLYHTYCKLTVYSLPVEVIHIVPECTEYEFGKQYNISGYFDRHKPQIMCGFTIELVREITKEDLNSNHDWYGYDIGDPTGRFNSREDVEKMAKKILEIRFSDSKWYHDYE